MLFEGFVAARYLRGKRKNRFVSLITIISIAGVSVGVIALIVVMSVMTGFDNAFRDTIIGNRSHLSVLVGGGWPMEDPEQVIDELESFYPDEIVGASPFVEIPAMLVNGERVTGGFIIGVDPEREQDVTDLGENLTTNNGRKFGGGKLPGEKEIVLGYRLARTLRADIGSEINVITSKQTMRPFIGNTRGAGLWLRVSGISEARMYEFDSVYGHVDIPTARMLTGREGVDGVHLKLTDPDLAFSMAERIERELPYGTETWYQSDAAFFGALEQEKAAMFIILVFIVLVAAFNITSTLIMIVMEKRHDIGILRTIGTSATSILMIFMIEGLMIGLSGTFLGVVIGALLAYNINPVAEFIAGLLGVPLFDSVFYLFDKIPHEVVPSDIAVISIASVVLTFLSTIYPAWSASRLKPVDAMRRE